MFFHHKESVNAMESYTYLDHNTWGKGKMEETQNTCGILTFLHIRW